MLARGDSELIRKYVEAMVNGNYKSLTGASYLVDPIGLLKHSNSRDIAEYIGLASFRKFTDFKVSRNTRLLKTAVPIWVPDQVVLENPLLDTKHPQFIKFKYEH